MWIASSNASGRPVRAPLAVLDDERPSTNAQRRVADPEILPSDAPVWPGPSKTAKMSPAARGVFSRQWHARPENQVGMFVGSGGSGEIGRKLAFDVAYKAATSADVRVRPPVAVLSLL
jgi:hypothetical protein